MAFLSRLRSLIPSRAAVRDKLRATPLLLLGAVTFLWVLHLNPAKVGLLIWGASRIGLCAYLGYWVDRIIFPYARPHALEGIAQGTAWKRRALIVSAAIIAGALLP
jgi:hypothetical protein